MENLLLLFILSFSINVFAFKKHDTACPAMNGYIVLSGALEVTYYHWTGAEGFYISAYELSGVAGKDFKKNRELFWLSFIKGSYESKLYSAADCSVKGSIKATQISQIGTQPIYVLN